MHFTHKLKFFMHTAQPTSNMHSTLKLINLCVLHLAIRKTTFLPIVDSQYSKDISALKSFHICFQGHAVSGALFGGHGGGSEQPAYQQDTAAAPHQDYNQPMGGQQQHQGPCQFEMQQFVECAQNQRDITLCQGFNEALRQCKLANGKKQMEEGDMLTAVI